MRLRLLFFITLFSSSTLAAVDLHGCVDLGVALSNIHVHGNDNYLSDDTWRELIWNNRLKHLGSLTTEKSESIPNLKLLRSYCERLSLQANYESLLRPLIEYTEFDFDNINADLRADTLPAEAASIDQVFKLFEKPLHELTVWRGERTYSGRPKFVRGNTYLWKAYTSTSTERCPVRATPAQNGLEFKSTPCLKVTAPAPSAFFSSSLLAV